VEKDADQHLFQLYVKPHDATPDYSPGKIRVFLRREYPDYMYVALEQEAMKDGTLHVQVAISPEKQETYTITVLDERKERTLLLYWKKLRDIPARKKPQREDGTGKGASESVKIGRTGASMPP
jgi:predicted TIM-barrel fold metal-dependent hydrolase